MNEPSGKPLVVGLTGGVASGKSAAAAELESLGIPVIDTDALARAAVEPGSETLAEIREVFGPEVMTADGTLDRRAMRRRVFENEGDRDRLEAILHPRIAELLERELAGIQRPWCVVAIPLLVEAGWVDRVDRILVVDCPPALQIARLVERDGIDESAARGMIGAQVDRSDRLAVAHDVLDNAAGLGELRMLVRSLHRAMDAIARQ